MPWTSEKMRWAIDQTLRVQAGLDISSALANLQLKGKYLLLSAGVFRKTTILDQIASQLDKVELDIRVQSIVNPDIAEIRQIASEYPGNRFDGLIAIGGGSIIDTAKVLSALFYAENRVDPLLGLEKGETPVLAGSLPLIAIPGTSGTGSECTPFATIWDKVRLRKYSLSSPHIVPKHVIMDPSLTVNMPYLLTLYTALDALSHACESLWNRNYSPVSEAAANTAISKIIRYLPQALERLDEPDPRAELQNAAYLSGLAISQTKTAIAHAISYPLTYRYLVPHGLACSFTIPAIYSFLKNNYSLSEELDKVLKKAAVFVQNLGLQENLREYLSPEDFYQLSSEMTNPERFRNFVHDINPVQLRSIMRDAFVDKNL